MLILYKSGQLIDMILHTVFTKFVGSKTGCELYQSNIGEMLEYLHWNGYFF